MVAVVGFEPTVIARGRMKPLPILIGDTAMVSIYINLCPHKAWRRSL
jgi:hypothetical protein